MVTRDDILRKIRELREMLNKYGLQNAEQYGYSRGKYIELGNDVISLLYSYVDFQPRYMIDSIARLQKQLLDVISSKK